MSVNREKHLLVSNINKNSNKDSFTWIILVLLLISLTSFSRNNDALIFDGFDDYIIVPNNYNLIGDRTFSFWMNKSHSEQPTETIIYKANEYAISYNNQSGKIIVEWGNGKLWEYRFESKSKISKSVWNHIVISKSFKNHNSTIFINGKEDMTVATSNSMAINNAPFIIGGILEAGISTNNFKGKLKEIQIWNKTFNCNYIKQTNKIKTDITEIGLVGYYQLNKSKIIDKSSSFKIAVSEFEGLDGIVFNKSIHNFRNSQNTDKAAIYPSNLEFLNINFNKNKSALSADLGASININQSKNSFSIQIQKDMASFYKVNVYNVLGEALFSSDYFIGEQGQAFGENLSPGVYWVDITKGLAVQRVKVLKQ